VALAGCGQVQVRSGTVTDQELQASGAWTARDARARALLDLDAPARLRGRYPVRLVPLRRKVLMEVDVGGATIVLPRLNGSSLEGLAALLGWDYERRYQYVAAAHAYVLLNRDRPATVIGEDGGPVLPVAPTPPAAFRELQRTLDRDVSSILDAAARVARPAPAPPPLPDVDVQP
jgi:hypothetical protein